MPLSDLKFFILGPHINTAIPFEDNANATNQSLDIADTCKDALTTALSLIAIAGIADIFEKYINSLVPRYEDIQIKKKQFQELVNKCKQDIERVKIDCKNTGTNLDVEEISTRIDTLQTQKISIDRESSEIDRKVWKAVSLFFVSICAAVSAKYALKHILK